MALPVNKYPGNRQKKEKETILTVASFFDAILLRCMSQQLF